MASEGGPRHVLIIPGPPQESHISCMLRFALLLSSVHYHRHGLLFSFGYPARFYGLALQRRKLPLSLPPTLRLHVLEDGLPRLEQEAPTPEQYKAAKRLIKNNAEALIKQYGTLDGQALGDHQSVDGAKANGPSSGSCTLPTSWPPICCIIADTFLDDAQGLADKFGIPRVDFWTSHATCYNMIAHLPKIIEKGLLPLPEGVGAKWRVDAPLIDFVPGLPPFQLTDLPRELLKTSDVQDGRFQFMLNAFSRTKDADRILVHSIYELESGVYDAMQAHGYAIYPVGPMFDESSAATSSRDECLEWLDQQKPASVVYIAFGTFAKLNLEEMHSLALGLEASNHLFLWIVRMDALPAASLPESLPEGFMQRTVSQGKGFIATWAPQTDVLKHSAVGAFISHCGWNSTLESLWEGVPMVACPRSAEQRLNARLIVDDWKVGVEIEREDDGSFKAEAVQRAMEEVVGKQEVKERAMHYKQVARDAITQGTSHANIVSFVDYLLHLPVPVCRMANEQI